MADMLRVLYVDDEPSLLDLCKNYLERTGEFSVDTVLSGKDALTQIGKQQYDAIVSDYQMPEMDGISLLKQVRTIHADVSFILFTGKGREDVVIEAIGNGADFYLQKGGDPRAQFAELMHKVRQAVSKRHAGIKLVESEKRLTDIINFLPDATFAIDRDGQVIAWNRAIEEMTGVPAADMLGKGDHEYAIPFYGMRRPVLIDLIFKPEEEIREKYKGISREKDSIIAETDLPTPKGMLRVLMGKASPLYNQNGEIVGAIESIRDITQKKETEAALQEQNLFLGEMNTFSLELASFPTNESLRKFIVKKLMALTGAAAAWYSDYNPADRTLAISHLESEPGILAKAIKVIGKDPYEIKTVVNEEQYRTIVDSVVVRLATLSEISFGQIPEIISTTIQKVLGIDHFIGLVYVIEGELYGTSVLAIKKDEPDPSTRQLESFSHIVAVSLRRRSAEKKLLESEEKFRTVADYTYGWEYWEAPDFSISYMSPSCERISGYRPEDFYQTPSLLDSIVDPRDRKIWENHRKETNKTEIALNVEFRIVRKDGGIRWINHTCHPVFDSDSRPNGRRASNRDITDQKRAETDLNRAYEEIAASEEELRAQLDAIREHDAMIRASEEKFRETTNSIPGVVFQFVAKPDGSFMLPYVSDRARDILGIDDTRGDMFEPLTSRIHPDDKAGFFASVDEAVRSRSPWRAEARFIKPSGETIWLQGISSPVEHDGRLVFSGVLIDISDRKRGELALRESEERYRSLVDISPDAVLIHQDGNIVYMNPAGLALVGAASPDDAINKNVFDFIHPDFRDTVRMNIANDLRGEVSPQVELRMCRTDGTSVDVEGRGIKTWFEGRPAVQVAIRDITWRKKNEEALRESEEKFRVIFGVQQIGILMIDALSHEIVDLNPVAADMIGLGRDEIIGEVCHQFICPNECGKCPVGDLGQTIDKAERVLISKDRGRIPVLKTVTRACLGGRPYFVESFIDISQRIKAEEALQKSESHLSSIIRVAPIGIGVVVNRIIQTVNDQLCQMSGYSAEELIGKSARILYPTQEDFDYVGREKYAQIEQKGSGSVETTWQRKDGTIIDILLSSTPFNPSDLSAGVTFTALDITKSKKGEKLLQDSENKFSSIFHGSPVALTLVSAIDGTFVDVNEAFVRSTRYTREEVIGQTSEALGIFADNNQREQLAASLRDHRIVEDREINIRLKTGEIRPCLFSTGIILIGGKPYILSTVRDNLARKQAEDALKESEAKFRLLTENSPDHIFIQDRSFHYTWVLNPQLGLTQEDMLGKTDYDFLSKEDADKLTSIKRQVLETGKAVPYETSLISQRGETEYFDGIYLPKYDTEGKIEGLMGYFRNITERKRDEERLSEVNNAFLKFRPDPLDNINILTGLAGKMLKGTCALYNRLEGGMLCSLGMWNTPPDFSPCDQPEGHICNDIIKNGSNSPVIITNLLESAYAETDPNVRRYQLQTYIGIPVEMGNRSLGSLCVVYQHSYSPSPQDLEILSFLGKAIAIEDERRTTGMALLESEAKHRVLIEESSDPFFSFTPDGEYTYANQALASAFGKPVVEIVGRRIWDFFPKQEADRRFAALSQVFRTGEKNIVEGPVPAADGDRYYLTTITPVKGPSGGVISAICTSIDITGRKRSEEALRQSEESYRGLFNTIQQAIYILDDEGKFIDVNEGAEKMYGYSREEFMGKTPEFVSAPGKNDMGAVVGHLQKAYSGDPQQFEFWGLRKNHEIFPKDVRLYKGTYFGRDVIVAIGTDITERRNTEVAFQAMVTSMVGTTGMNSLRKITENISSWLGAECVMIGEIQPDGQTVQVLSMLLEGKEVPDYSYTLRGTPCDHVADKGFCLYPDNAIQLFPEARDLVELNIKGYVGTPLRSSDGQVLGILCALFRNPVKSTPGMQEIMNIIAVKAAAEIESMRMLTALRQSEDDLAQVMDGIPTLISYMDTELRFVLVNKAHLEWYGCTKEDLIGKRLKDTLPDDVFLRMFPYYQQVLGGHEVTVESPTRDKDGRDRVLNVRMVPHKHGEQVVGIFAALEDITERKWAEEKLRESEERYRSNIEQSLDGILISDEHGDITIWNDSMVSITGIQPGEAIGHPIWEIMYRLAPDEDKSPELLKTIQDTLNNIFEQKMDWTGDSREQVIQCPDGIRKDVQESSFVIKTGNTLKFGASIRDISERRRAEEAVRQANKKLNLLSGITRHDINNQLMVLKGYLSILKNKHPDPSVDAYMPKITTAAERISSMIQFTKEYEEIGVNAPVWQDCRRLVDTAVREVPLGKVVVKNDFTNGTEVFADPLIAKVFFNLMDNAVRYGGKITTIRFSLEESGNDRILLCEDDGNGIPFEEKEKIFDRGFGKNTGMGLFLAREILDITGITIRETGEPGKGARFEMTVPKGICR